ncbi:hypothetical protein EYF80_010621 [Liparis tanakae]|uniref:Uncharacterized protein n=1 Tax=Liparis tanakae TaxID=230148 RepID=A0A4Z2IPS2_9TELE|nr:hypothetical protein EYF80_010621 [Liparis tanakae]
MASTPAGMKITIYCTSYLATVKTIAMIHKMFRLIKAFLMTPVPHESIHLRYCLHEEIAHCEKHSAGTGTELNMIVFFPPSVVKGSPTPYRGLDGALNWLLPHLYLDI